MKGQHLHHSQIIAVYVYLFLGFDSASSLMEAICTSTGSSGTFLEFLVNLISAK